MANILYSVLPSIMTSELHSTTFTYFWNLTAAILLIYFFVRLVTIIISSANSLFNKKQAWRHRLSGLLLFVWHLIGVINVYYLTSPLSSNKSPKLVLPHRLHLLLSIEPLKYDICLGILGTLTAFSAAYDFKKHHSHVKNKASGTLDKEVSEVYYTICYT